MDSHTWVDERHPQPLGRGAFTYVTNGLDTELGYGWRDSSIVAIDTVVRYRTFTQLREALDLPFPQPEWLSVTAACSCLCPGLDKEISLNCRFPIFPHCVDIL